MLFWRLRNIKNKQKNYFNKYKYHEDNQTQYEYLEENRKKKKCLSPSYFQKCHSPRNNSCSGYSNINSRGYIDFRSDRNFHCSTDIHSYKKANRNFHQYTTSNSYLDPRPDSDSSSHIHSHPQRYQHLYLQRLLLSYLHQLIHPLQPFPLP